MIPRFWCVTPLVPLVPEWFVLRFSRFFRDSSSSSGWSLINGLLTIGVYEGGVKSSCAVLPVEARALVFSMFKSLGEFALAVVRRFEGEGFFWDWWSGPCTSFSCGVFLLIFHVASSPLVSRSFFFSYPGVSSCGS